jgi:hypothetical protein
MRWKRTRREDPRARLADDIRRTAGLMAAVVADAERLRVAVPDLVLGCASAWQRWARHLRRER